MSKELMQVGNIVDQPFMKPTVPLKKYTKEEVSSLSDEELDKALEFKRQWGNYEAFSQGVEAVMNRVGAAAGGFTHGMYPAGIFPESEAMEKHPGITEVGELVGNLFPLSKMYKAGSAILKRSPLFMQGRRLGRATVGAAEGAALSAYEGKLDEPAHLGINMALFGGGRFLSGLPKVLKYEPAPGVSMRVKRTDLYPEDLLQIPKNNTIRKLSPKAQKSAKDISPVSEYKYDLPKKAEVLTEKESNELIERLLNPSARKGMKVTKDAAKKGSGKMSSILLDQKGNPLKLMPAIPLAVAASDKLRRNTPSVEMELTPNGLVERTTLNSYSW